MSAPADPDRDKLLERAMARHQYSGDALIEVLHAAQQLHGYLDRQLLLTIARKLKLPPSRVLGVATFYHLFRFHPCAKHSATVCMGTACYVAGAQDLLTALRESSGAARGWTVEAGRCLGSCGLAPVVICNGEALSRVTPARLEACLKETDDRGNA